LIDDVHEPLEQYKAHFKTAHIKNTSDFFEDLVRQSGVDEEANSKTVKQLRQLENQAGGLSNKNLWWRILREVVVVATLSAMLYFTIYYSWIWVAALGALVIPVIFWLNRTIGATFLKLADINLKVEEKRTEAWEQMAPLNLLYTWDIISRLIKKTVPRIEFDHYFSNGRIEELNKIFDWSGDLGKEQSIVFSQSGVINGNPFILARTLTHWMGSKIYYGSHEIKWTENVLDADGKPSTKNCSETLTVSIERPFPEYENQTFIIYGNEAAPDLTFSRIPNELSRLSDGFFNKIAKNRAIRKIEKKSRDIGDGKTFTAMSNREFDACFNAIDRNHEVQFRLLFTPLAQQEMLKLLKDRQVGYGDDFAFNKINMINVVESKHLDQTDISGDPKKFHAYELAQARNFFNNYHNDFFRSFYFGIAPLLSIPLYQQHRPHSDIYMDTYSRKSCFWEHEALANYYGEEQFKHKDCVTRSILKTSSKIKADGSQIVRVVASGYSSAERVEYVEARGGDGNIYEIPVDWIEYEDVQHASNILLKEKVSYSEEVNNIVKNSDISTFTKVVEEKGLQFNNIIIRRSIISAVLPNLPE